MNTYNEVTSIGKLQRVPLREVWRHEAHDFTTWLEDNGDVLSEVLDLTLVTVEREKKVGDFSVDLVGEDDKGAAIVIENQLERSNHDHLGKVLTYLAALDAEAAVWIVSQPRPEHVKAFTWLNESTSTSFFLLQIEAVRIGDSPPAPLLTKIVGPSSEARATGALKKEYAERYGARKRFWTVVLDRARAKSKLHANISPSQHNWIGAASGVRGLSWTYAVRQHDVQVELYIDRGVEDENAVIFDELESHREEIEEAFGHTIEWQKLEGKRACRIRHRIAGGGWRDEERWTEAADAAVDAMVRLEQAIGPFLRRLEVG